MLRIHLTFIFMAIPGLAQAFDTPRALLEAIYQPYQAGKTHESLDPFYSNRIKGLFIDHANRVTGDVATLDTDATPNRAFNPFLDSDHALLLDVTISDPFSWAKTPWRRSVSIISTIPACSPSPWSKSPTAGRSTMSPRPARARTGCSPGC